MQHWIKDPCAKAYETLDADDMILLVWQISGIMLERESERNRVM